MQFAPGCGGFSIQAEGLSRVRNGIGAPGGRSDQLLTGVPSGPGIHNARGVVQPRDSLPAPSPPPGQAQPGAQGRGSGAVPCLGEDVQAVNKLQSAWPCVWGGGGGHICPAPRCRDRARKPGGDWLPLSGTLAVGRGNPATCSPTVTPGPL